MTPEEESRLRSSIKAHQEMAAHYARKGSDTMRPVDPSYYFETAREASAAVELLQRQLEVAGLPREPNRDVWDFGRP